MTPWGLQVIMCGLALDLLATITVLLTLAEKQGPLTTAPGVLSNFCALCQMPQTVSVGRVAKFASSGEVTKVSNHLHCS